MYDLSIIIVTYNCVEYLTQCFNSLYKNLGNLKAEIIVIDNGSSDNTVAFLQKHFSNIHLIINSKNIGFASANNIGIKLSSGKFILLLNPDTMIQKNAIQKSMRFMMNHKDAGIVGGTLLNDDLSYQESYYSFLNFWKIFFESTFIYLLYRNAVEKYINRFKAYHYVDVVKGAFIMIRKELIEDIGLLDEKYFMYSEEMDYCYRAKVNAWKVVRLPDIKIIHFGGGSTKKIRKEMFYELHKSKLYFLSKYRSKFYVKTCEIFLGFGVKARVVLWFIVMQTGVGNIKEIAKNRYEVYKFTSDLYS